MKTVSIVFVSLLCAIATIQWMANVAEGSPVPNPWSWGFSSSRSNADIAARNYPNSGMERWVARSFGDEIPNMRNDLIRRKNDGEGFIRRHYNAWKTGNNWSVDRDNDRKEREDPYFG